MTRGSQIIAHRTRQNYNNIKKYFLRSALHNSMVYTYIGIYIYFFIPLTISRIDLYLTLYIRRNNNNDNNLS